MDHLCVLYIVHKDGNEFFEFLGKEIVCFLDKTSFERVTDHDLDSRII